VCSRTSRPTSPVVGCRPVCPDTNTRLPKRVAAERLGLGAAEPTVTISFLGMMASRPGRERLRRWRWTAEWARGGEPTTRLAGAAGDGPRWVEYRRQPSEEDTGMRTSTERVLTTQAGRLPRPDDLIDLNRARQAGRLADEPRYQARLASAVEDAVRRQRTAGIDVAGDGEYGKAMGQRVNYGAWWSYSFQRLGGLELGTEIYKVPGQRSEPGRVRLTSFSDRRDRALFAGAYADPDSGVSTMPRGGAGMRLPVCVGPLTYTGHEAIAADIPHLKAR